MTGGRGTASQLLAGGKQSATTGKAAAKTHPGRDGSLPPANRIPGWHPVRGACPGWLRTGGVAGAQPPANGCHASGVKHKPYFASSLGRPLGQAG
jgi:hypothetical protein